jgi:hypothetical protein
VKTLARYLEIIVDPTFDEFHVNRGSVRHAYLNQHFVNPGGTTAQRLEPPG